MPTRRDLEIAARMRRLVDAAEPKIRRQLEQALAALRRGVPESVLEQLIASRDAFGIHDLSALLPASLAPALASLARLYEAGVNAGSFQVSQSLGVRWRFNLTNPLAIQAARDQGAALVTAVTKETREAIRAVIEQAFRDGLPPREAARLLRPLIGLTRQQALAITALRQQLIAEGVSRRVAQDEVRAAAEKALRRRALMIARTETIGASTRGQLNAWDGAVRSGLLPQRARKVWITTPDDRRCPFCARMEGQTAQVGTAFVGGRFGRIQGPPLHPNCRCAVGIHSVPRVRITRRAA